MSESLETSMDAVGQMKPEPTPGPWTCVPSPLNPALFEVYDGDGNFITDDFDMREEISRLIAAAPDMLEALENLENDNGETMHPSAWKLVNAAIAKAKGGAS